MAGFVQIIEFSSSRVDEIRALSDEFRERRAGATPLQRVTVGADRDRPGVHLLMAEFPSYEQAMENSNDPATTEFAEKMAALCDGPPTFYNLDVIHSETL